MRVALTLAIASTLTITITLTLTLAACTRPAPERWDGPLLVIERGKALWRERCDPEAKLTPERRRALADAHRTLLGDAPVALSLAGATRARLDAERVECVVGECDGHQLGLGLDLEGTGALAPARVVGEARVSGLSPVRGGEGDAGQATLPDGARLSCFEGAETTRGAALACVAYASPSIVVVVRSRGVIQPSGEEDWRQVEWKAFRPSLDRVEAAPWVPARGASGSWRWPVAFLDDGAGKGRLLWLSSAGVVGPSRSETWLAEIRLAPRFELVADGEVFLGGFGQACE